MPQREAALLKKGNIPQSPLKRKKASPIYHMDLCKMTDIWQQSSIKSLEKYKSFTRRIKSLESLHLGL